MRVYVNIKAMGKRKPVLEKIPLEVDFKNTSSCDFVEAIVRKNVSDYNAKTVDNPLFRWLGSDEIENGQAAGKVSFADRKNENAQSAEKAVENALQAYEDGLFRLFIGDQEVSFDEKLELAGDEEITFIRMTMLAGRLW